MRKKIIAAVIVTALALCLAFTLAACNNNDGDGGKDGGDTGTLYSIQAPAASDVYTVSGLPESAREGDAVTFTVTLTHPADSVLNYVEVYGSEMKYNKLTPADDGSYSFTMPAEPVRVTVDADYYPDNDTDNFLTWDEDNPTTFEIWTPDNADDTYFPQWDDGKLTANVTETTLHYYDVTTFSLNTDVIPDDALSYSVDEDFGGGYATSFTVNIDRSKISVGTAKIVLIVENESSFGDDSVITCTVTVTEAPEIVHVDTWTETVVFNVSTIDSDRLMFSFEDLDYVANTDAPQYQTFIQDEDYTVDNDGKATLTIQYVPGHNYAVTIMYRGGTNTDEPYIAFDLSHVNAEYSDNEGLSFTADGGSIEFRIYVR